MKILYTATVLSHICQFHIPHMKALHKRNYCIHVAAHDNLLEKNGLQLSEVDKFIEIPFHRSPFSKSNIIALQRLCQLILREKYDVIVCNTPVGSVLTRIAAQKMRSYGTRVYYIAHGFHFYKGAPLKNWLVYYPIEKIMAHFCDAIITVNEEDYLFAKKALSSKVERIHGIGVANERYHSVSEEERFLLREKEGLCEKDFLVLCTGELNRNKDQKTLLEATALIIEKVPNIIILLAGNGPLENELKAYVEKLGIQDVVRFLGYRTDLQNIVPAVDVVVSCSWREGMPLNIIEAMLCGRPIIAAENRGTRELISSEKQNGILFTPGDSVSLAKQLFKLFLEPEHRKSIGARAEKSVLPYETISVSREVLSIIDGGVQCQR